MKLIYGVCRGAIPLQELEEKALSDPVASSSNQGILRILGPSQVKSTCGSLVSSKNFAQGEDDRSKFYYNLYAGLIAEAQGRPAAAQNFLERAVKSPYSKEGDYMWFVASVHCKLRGWNK